MSSVASTDMWQGQLRNILRRIEEAMSHPGDACLMPFVNIQPPPANVTNWFPPSAPPSPTSPLDFDQMSSEEKQDEITRLLGDLELHSRTLG